MNALLDAGVLAERVPLSGSAPGQKCDVVLPIGDRIYRVEAKHHGATFKRLYDWLTKADLLIVRADRETPLAVLPIDLLIDLVCKADGKRRIQFHDEEEIEP